MDDMNPPLIGLDPDITTDERGVTRWALRASYSQAVVQAGGLPIILPPHPEQAGRYVDRCDALILTGGDDPRTEPFGQPTHPRARLMEPARQAFIMAMLDALAARPDKPVLGICLGMQMMALHAGGLLHQYLPDVLTDATIHQGCQWHGLALTHPDASLFSMAKQDAGRALTPGSSFEGGQCNVVSAHQQAVADAGRLRVIAQAPDGVVEAVDDPGRPFYAGVQWHPERGDDAPLSLGLFRRVIAACRSAN